MTDMHDRHADEIDDSYLDTESARTIHVLQMLDRIRRLELGKHQRDTELDIRINHIGDDIVALNNDVKDLARDIRGVYALYNKITLSVIGGLVAVVAYMFSTHFK